MTTIATISAHMRVQWVTQRPLCPRMPIPGPYN